MSEILKKLLEVKKSVDFLKKESTNQMQKFKYVSSSQVLGALREKMNDVGLLLETRVKNTMMHHKKDKQDKQHLVELWMEMVWIDVDTGEERVVDWYAQGTDQHEKSVGKALTYGEKFFLLKQFNIPTDKDDPDAGSGGKRGPDSRNPKVANLKTGMKMLAGKKAPDGVAMATKYKKFVETCGEVKAVIGPDQYYQILLDVANVEKSISILDYDMMKDVLGALGEAERNVKKSQSG